MKNDNNYEFDFVDNFGTVKRDEPDENYIDIRVEMSDFRNMVLTFSNLLAERNLITDAEVAIFDSLYNLTARGDIFGKSVTARVYKRRYAIANSEPTNKE